MAKQLDQQATPDLMTRLERKIVLDPQSVDFILAWLRHACIVDISYPVSIIQSLYFDTPDFDSYHECINGDIYKNKVRLRWYDSPASKQAVPAYVELKTKVGFNTLKRRQLTHVSGATITDGRINDIISQKLLTETLAKMHYFPDKPLNPVIIIRYKRYRFREPSSGISVTFDTGISSWMVTPHMALWSSCVELPVTVLELKGGTMELPANLHALKELSPQWSGFSKYAKCIESHQKPLSSHTWLEL